MPQKTYHLEGIGNVTLTKLSRSKNIRIRINGSKVSVTLPRFMPYKTALHYAQKKRTWILENTKPPVNFSNGMLIPPFNAFHIFERSVSRVSSRQTDDMLVVSVPEGTTLDSSDVQSKIRAQIIKQLRLCSEERIIPRVRLLANQYQFEVNSVVIKRLRGRWGSCSQKNDLVFNLFLVQMPDEYIDYVIFHELCHTVHLNHSKQFWQLVEAHIPNYKTLRKSIKTFSPDIRAE